MGSDSIIVEKIAISGPTLCSIFQRFSSSYGDVDGFLFGNLSRLPPPDLSDDDPSSSCSSAASGSSTLPPFAASITGFICSGAPMTFYDSLGRVDPHSLRRAAGEERIPVLVGWFSGRRRTPLRPSLRELSVSNSLFETPILGPIVDPTPSRPCIFLLLSSSSTENQAIHTYEYRAFHLRRNPTIGAGLLEPKPLHIVNIGPDFRGQYGSFSLDSELPWMPLKTEDEIARKDSLWSLKERAAAQTLLDSTAEGFTMERLGYLVGPGVAEYVSELEDLYKKMLLKLEGLARQVEKSSVRVHDQEAKNLKLRCRLAGLE